MATNLPSRNHADEEDYIDMEASSSSNFFCYSLNSPSQTREFEFQTSSGPNERETTSSPADELFYKGKLLPLHLPPRLQMVQKLLQNSNPKEASEDEDYNISFTSSTTLTTNIRTPLESSDVSPSESCQVSGEPNLNQYFFEWSTELSGSISDNPKKSWSKKLKLIKQSLFGQKLNASQAYLKSLFSKPACSNESNYSKAASNEAEHVSKHKKVEKKRPLGQTGNRTYLTLGNAMESFDREMVDDGVSGHRKSFAGAIKWNFATNYSSSSSSSGDSSFSSLSFSINSSGFYELEFLRRSSSSANSEIESLIEGAIAHCKKSQQPFSSGKKASEVGLCSPSASSIAVSGDKETGNFCGS